jgi:RNA polymerase sigma-70 factor (ECF subfamily)
MTDIEDSYIIEKFNNEESRHYAFNLLIRKYQQRIYWHVRRMVIVHDDADDLVQNIFIKVWRHLEKFNQESSLYTWLYRIATNECLTHLKNKRRKFFLPIVDVEFELSRKMEDDHFFSGDEISKKLQKAILTLPEKQRTVFNMKYFDEMTYEEMSEVLETSVGALKASYHHAVKKIEGYLENN